MYDLYIFCEILDVAACKKTPGDKTGHFLERFMKFVIDIMAEIIRETREILTGFGVFNRFLIL